MRCPECNKFVSYDEPAIDVDDISIDNEGSITGQAHIELNCQECGTTLKEAYLDINQKADAKEHDSKECGTSIEVTCTDPIVEIGSRYQKTYYGATITVTASCECGAIDVAEMEITVKTAASEFEEVA